MLAEEHRLYRKEALLREAFLNLPFPVAFRMLDDTPYLTELKQQRFRSFFWYAGILEVSWFCADGCSMRFYRVGSRNQCGVISGESYSLVVSMICRPDILVLNLFNLTLGSCVDSEEFWSGTLAER